MLVRRPHFIRNNNVQRLPRLQTLPIEERLQLLEQKIRAKGTVFKWLSRNGKGIFFTNLTRLSV